MKRNQKIITYTEQEKEFLHRVLELLGIEFLLHDAEGAITGKEFSFSVTLAEQAAIACMMRANYEKNFC